uniref:NADH-ubiquinone oxidoreductase chain 4 n=1 Tax=Jakoba libera TaxID=143017 RepID=M4QA52_JAKLI|nr:NADH dehydrogenase subunit 4 [Jakoba libera]AGH24231.1 NADH dehydrogenase subunit 4 [Jakoba libera]
MFQSNLLPILILTPIVGIFLLFLIPSSNQVALKMTSLLFSLLTFVFSLWLWILFDESTSKFQFQVSYDWFSTSNVSATLGVDGISLFLVLLTTFLIPLCLLVSWESIKHSVKEYLVCFLLLESLLILIFVVLDLVLFYVFFESVLLPMFIMIGVWGSRERKIRAAYMLFLYTLLGSLFMLVAIMCIYFEAGTTDLQTLLTVDFGERRELLLWLAFFVSFAVKVPMLPFHIWLPEAHVEAPTAGSVLLAGVLLKLGGYGLIRFSLGMFPDASSFFSPLVFTMSILAIIYTSLTTLRQIDLKRIIAYSSVAHMNYVTIGIFSQNIQGLQGSILLMLSHGIVSSALFMCIGVLYDRHKTRLIHYYSGLCQVMPVFATLFMVFIMANLSLPSTSSFVGEFLVLVGIFSSNTTVAFLATTGIILGAAYSLWLYNRVIFGSLKLNFASSFEDVTRREVYMLMPLVLLTFLMGIYPSLFLDPMYTSLSTYVGNLK